jgi:hypothetical protein
LWAKFSAITSRVVRLCPSKPHVYDLRVVTSKCICALDRILRSKLSFYFEAFGQ